jgi:hypothetical protein
MQFKGPLTVRKIVDANRAISAEIGLEAGWANRRHDGRLNALVAAPSSSLRCCAAEMGDPDSRQAMLELADCYELLAQRADERAEEGQPLGQ